MRNFFLFILFLLLSMTQLHFSHAASDPNDSMGTKDPALFSNSRDNKNQRQT